jgi:hypothetical protein
MVLQEYEWVLYEVENNNVKYWQTRGTALTLEEAEQKAKRWLSQHFTRGCSLRYEIFEVTRKSLGVGGQSSENKGEMK